MFSDYSADTNTISYATFVKHIFFGWRNVLFDRYIWSPMPALCLHFLHLSSVPATLLMWPVIDRKMGSNASCISACILWCYGVGRFCLMYLLISAVIWTAPLLLFVCIQIPHIILPEVSFGLRVLSSPASVGLSTRVCVWINHELVRTITHHSFKLGSPNLDQLRKIHWWRCL